MNDLATNDCPAQQPDAAAWDDLLAAARAAASRAYAPYSGYPVGAAATTADGRLLHGCNVENASYGLTLCAECSLVSSLIGSGGGRLVAFVCVDRVGELILPCGRCRQLLFEHGGAELELLTATGVKRLAELLPLAWGPANLANAWPVAARPAPPSNPQSGVNH